MNNHIKIKTPVSDSLYCCMLGSENPIKTATVEPSPEQSSSQEDKIMQGKNAKCIPKTQILTHSEF